METIIPDFPNCPSERQLMLAGDLRGKLYNALTSFIEKKFPPYIDQNSVEKILVCSRLYDWKQTEVFS